MSSAVVQPGEVEEAVAAPGEAPEPAPEVAPPRPRSAWIGSLAAALVLVAVAGLVAVVFWPGHMNLDTLGELVNARTGRYTDWHSPVWSAIWRALLLSRLTSPGWMMAGAVLLMLTGLYLVVRARLARPWALVAAVAVLVFPPVLGWAVEIGTDVWFASSIVFGFGFACRCARTRGREQVVSAALAVVGALLAEAARPTAAPAVLALLCAVALAVLPERLRGWRRGLGVAATGLVATALAVGVVLGVQRFVLQAAETHPEQGTYDYDLVALSLREDQVLLPEDMYRRQDLTYLDRYSHTSSVFDISALLFGEHAAIPIPVEGSRLESLRQAWLSAIRERPLDYLGVRLDNALAQLTITSAPLYAYYAAPPAAYGFPVAFPALHDAAMRYVAVGSTNDPVNGNRGGPLQHVWPYVLVLVAGVVVGLVRRRPAADAVVALLAAALLLYAVTISLLSPGVQYRYIYPSVVAGAVLLVVLAADAARWLWATARRRLRALGPGTPGAEDAPLSL